MRFLLILIIPAFALCVLTGCGKKGPPLPPLPPGQGAGLHNAVPAQESAAGEQSIKRLADQSARKEIS